MEPLERPGRIQREKILAPLALTLVVAGSAAAKEFPPGELRVCGATQCRVVTAAQSKAFSALLWSDRPVRRAPTPPVGSPIYQLRFEAGPMGAIVGPTAIRVHGPAVAASSEVTGTACRRRYSLWRPASGRSC